MPIALKTIWERPYKGKNILKQLWYENSKPKGYVYHVSGVGTYDTLAQAKAAINKLGAGKKRHATKRKPVHATKSGR